MAKPIEIAVVTVAVLGVGGVFLAGYLLGRSTAAAPSAPATTSSVADDDGDDGDDGEPLKTTKKPDRRSKSRRAPAPSVSSSAGPSPSAAPSERLYASPDVNAPLLLTLDPGAKIEILQTIPGFHRVRAKAADGSVVVGWMVWSTRRPSSWGGVMDGVSGTTIHGTTRFVGTPPEMKVPKKVADAEVCKDSPLPSNAVIVNDGRIADVLVRVARGEVERAREAKGATVELSQQGCVYWPRVQGAMPGQKLEIWNRDATLHNSHAYRGDQTAWNAPQVKGADPLVKEIPDADIFKITCDVHPWMRAFIVVTDHPYFAVSDTGGAFTIAGVPRGERTLEAWHPRYGWQRQRVKVKAGESVEATFTFHDTDPEPPENQGELRDLF